MVTENAQSTATAADSVAVNTPLKMPPRMMKMVIKPHSASTTIFKASFIGIARPLGKSRFLAMNRHMMASVSPSNKPGSTPARNSAAIDTEPPAANE